MTARGWLLVLLLLVFTGGGIFAWMRFEGSAPEVAAPESLVVGAAGRQLRLDLSDAGSGLRSALVVLAHDGGEQTLADERWPGGLLEGGLRGEEPAGLEVTIDPSGLPRAVEQATLRIAVRDWSWRGGLAGNLTQLEIPIAVDRRPPRVAVRTGLSYVRRGGAGAVAYELSEAVVRDGVEVGDVFFPGFAHDGRRVAIYAVPADGTPDPQIRVVAEDAAGNVARVRWPAVLNERTLPEANVTLPMSFLEDKVPELAAAEGIDATDRVAAFARINTEVRAANEERIRELLSEPSGEKLWSGAFRQLANSQVTSRFAERRTYFVGGQNVSKAIHFGYDLASTAAAPITAAAAGRVVYTDELGIYGNCVLIDHGLGVATLYGHLSRLDSAPGDRVEAGQVVGLSGATGLAGGDHLHFAVLVSGTYVDPIEWWDEKWVRENIENRIAPGE